MPTIGAVDAVELNAKTDNPINTVEIGAIEWNAKYIVASVADYPPIDRSLMVQP